MSGAFRALTRSLTFSTMFGHSLGVSQRPLTLILLQKYRDTNERRIVNDYQNNSINIFYVIAPGLLQDFPVEPPKIIPQKDFSCKSPCPVRAPPGPCKSPQGPPPPQEPCRGSGWALSSPPSQKALPGSTPHPQAWGPPLPGRWQCCCQSQVPVSLSLYLSLSLAVLLQKPSSCLSLSLSLSLSLFPVSFSLSLSLSLSLSAVLFPVSLSLSLSQCCFRSQVPVFQRPAPGGHHGTPTTTPNPAPAQPRDHRGYGGEGLQKISPNIFTGAKGAITALKK